MPSLNLAQQIAYKGSMRAAFVTLFVALALSATAQTPLIDRGRALLDKRDYEHATEVLEKAVAATPKNAEAHYLLAVAYGEQAMAASVFSRVSLAGKAKDQFEAAVQADPNHLDARMGLMQWYTVAPPIIAGLLHRLRCAAADHRRQRNEGDGA